MKGLFVAAVAVLGVIALGGCATSTSSGITHLGDGQVAVSINKGRLGTNQDPYRYDCSSGSTCTRIEDQ